MTRKENLLGRRDWDGQKEGDSERRRDNRKEGTDDEENWFSYRPTIKTNRTTEQQTNVRRARPWSEVGDPYGSLFIRQFCKETHDDYFERYSYSYLTSTGGSGCRIM